MAVTAINREAPSATPAPSEFQRMRDHSMCSTRPLSDNGFDAVHTCLSEAYALLAVFEAGCEKGAAFENVNAEIQMRALSAVQRLIAMADFEAERIYDASHGRNRDV